MAVEKRTTRRIVPGFADCAKPRPRHSTKGAPLPISAPDAAGRQAEDAPCGSLPLKIVPIAMADPDCPARYIALATLPRRPSREDASKVLRRRPRRHPAAARRRGGSSAAPDRRRGSCGRRRSPTRRAPADPLFRPQPRSVTKYDLAGRATSSDGSARPVTWKSAVRRRRRAAEVAAEASRTHRRASLRRGRRRAPAS